MCPSMATDMTQWKVYSYWQQMGRWAGGMSLVASCNLYWHTQCTVSFCRDVPKYGSRVGGWVGGKCILWSLTDTSSMDRFLWMCPSAMGLANVSAMSHLLISLVVTSPGPSGPQIRSPLSIPHPAPMATCPHYGLLHFTLGITACSCWVNSCICDLPHHHYPRSPMYRTFHDLCIPYPASTRIFIVLNRHTNLDCLIKSISLQKVMIIYSTQS